MAQADDRAKWEIRPWAGTIDQLKRAAQQCEARVAAVLPHPADYDPEAGDQPFDAEKFSEWQDAEDARRVVIKIVEADGFSRKLTSIQDLEDLGSDRLDRIDGIDIDIGGGGYTNPSAGITASRDRGLSISLAGPDRTWTAGLRHELESELRPAGKLRPLPVGEDAYFGIAMLVFYLLLIGLGVYLYNQTEWPVAPRWGLAMGIASLAAVIVVTVGVRLPTLELLAPASRPAYERWRSRIAAATGAVILGIAASLVGAQLGG